MIKYISHTKNDGKILNFEYLTIKWISADSILISYNRDNITHHEYVSIGEFFEYIHMFGYSRISQYMTAKVQSEFFDLCKDFTDE